MSRRENNESLEAGPIDCASGLCPSYVREEMLPFGFCPGCGHIKIAGYIDEALRRLALPKNQVVIVSDIGCIGIIDRYYDANAFHGLHGRVITYASGIKLANPELTVIAVMGDGGAGIGGAHLLSVARRNLGITLIVANNFNYGMTGGQHSCTTPSGAVTTTTPKGNLEMPLDLLRTVLPSKPSFLARTHVWANDQVDLLVEAMQTQGFALIDIWDPCVAYFGGRESLNRKTIENMMEGLEMPVGVLYRGERPEYSRAWRELYSPQPIYDNEGLKIGGPGPEEGLEIIGGGTLEHKVGILFVGGAGQKIRSVATLTGAAAIMSGLRATQKDDYPITVRTGHSVAEVLISPDPIRYTGIDIPDIALVLAKDGLLHERRKLKAAPPEARVYIDEELVPLLETQAQVIALPLKETAKKVGKLCIGPIGAGAILAKEGLFPPEIFERAARNLQKGSVAESNIAGLRAGMLLMSGR